MADTLFEDLADRIRPYVRQCPQDTITQALLDTMRDFYNWTRAYQLEDNDTIQPTVSDYDLLLGTGIEAITIEEMTVNGFACLPKDPRWLSEHVGSNWRTRAADDFRYYTTLQPGQFTFPCVPTRMGTASGVAYRVSVRPTLAATGIDPAQASEWLEAWSTGTLWRLKSMGGTPPPAWYDPVGAKDKFAEYRHMRGEARIRINNAYNNPNQRLSNPRGFA